MIRFLIGLMMLIQLLVPASMILTYEKTLHEGVSYRFVVRPVDPADPFRGRYVRLTFDAQNVPYNKNQVVTYKYAQTVYAILDNDDNGYAKVVRLEKSKPLQGDYIKAEYRGANEERYFVALPFNRYYAEESKAPMIETSVRENSRQIKDSMIVTADVRIKDGLGVIEELYVGQQTIHEFLK